MEKGPKFHPFWPYKKHKEKKIRKQARILALSASLSSLFVWKLSCITLSPFCHKQPANISFLSRKRESVKYKFLYFLSYYGNVPIKYLPFSISALQFYSVFLFRPLNIFTWVFILLVKNGNIIFKPIAVLAGIFEVHFFFPDFLCLFVSFDISLNARAFLYLTKGYWKEFFLSLMESQFRGDTE